MEALAAIALFVLAAGVLVAVVRSSLSRKEALGGRASGARVRRDHDLGGYGRAVRSVASRTR